jgi:hypothetical protein
LVGENLACGEIDDSCVAVVGAQVWYV